SGLLPLVVFRPRDRRPRRAQTTYQSSVPGYTPFRFHPATNPDNAIDKSRPSKIPARQQARGSLFFSAFGLWMTLADPECVSAALRLWQPAREDLGKTDSPGRDSLRKKRQRRNRPLFFQLSRIRNFFVEK